MEHNSSVQHPTFHDKHKVSNGKDYEEGKVPEQGKYLLISLWNIPIPLLYLCTYVYVGLGVMQHGLPLSTRTLVP